MRTPSTASSAWKSRPSRPSSPGSAPAKCRPTSRSDVQRYAAGSKTLPFFQKYARRNVEAPGQPGNLPGIEAALSRTSRSRTSTDLYSFSLAPQLAVDFEPANHYTATHPESRFVRTLTVQLPTPDVRYMLRNRELVLDRGGTVTRRALADDAELLAVLAETFGLRFPAGTRFSYHATAD